jgi:predicted NUDIX family NTP pyrophosphohydrolase
MNFDEHEGGMAKQSAGILLYRMKGSIVEVFLVHSGGPFWAKKEQGAWSIPKGEFTDEEEPFVAAKREFGEELGSPAPEGDYKSLGSVKQAGGKTVYAWAIEADFNPKSMKSNTFRMEWPPKSGQEQEFPEVDRAAWMTLEKAETKLFKGQVPLMQVLADVLGKTIQSDQPPVQASLF